MQQQKGGIQPSRTVRIIVDDPRDIIVDDNEDPEIASFWPKQKNKVPSIFLHKPVDFELYVQSILSLGIRFYQPMLGKHYTKIDCATFYDHNCLIDYFSRRWLPYHTFEFPYKRVMKVVIRGLPYDTNLDQLKQSIESISVPILRIYKLNTKKTIKNPNFLVLVVVQNNDEGRKLLRLQKVLGYFITVEPAHKKVQQCHRCQKWGHSQTYCLGNSKCLKCAGDHAVQFCPTEAKVEPPKCANCNGDHTANYRKCPACPYSTKHKKFQKKKASRNLFRKLPPSRMLVTMANHNMLYRNVRYKLENNKSIVPSPIDLRPDPKPIAVPIVSITEPTPITIDPKYRDLDTSASDFEPTVSDPKPTVADSEPTVTDSEPTVTDSEPTVTDSEPTVTDTKPTVTDSEPTASELERTDTDPEHNFSEFEPTDTDPEPHISDPKPTGSRSKPVSGSKFNVSHQKPKKKKSKKKKR